ncbi:MAG: 7TM receptor with intracellular metal dependent phosphohydrolase [Spirochaetes bacterium]|nr:MAG: 7TM receptor with intracellular metal dependent phosphohydrolase [Spirochaetota bacterium]
MPWLRVKNALAGISAKDRFLAINFLAGLFIAALILVFLGPGALAVKRNFEGIVPGVIADRDISAGKDVIYIDQEATRLRVDAEERLVLPVFHVDNGITTRRIQLFKDFQKEFRSLMDQNIAQDTAVLMLQSKFPGILDAGILSALAASSLKSQILVYSDDILSSILVDGVFSLPSEGLTRYNQDYIDLKRTIGERVEFEQRPRDSMVTKSNLHAAIEIEAAKKYLTKPLASLVAGLVASFAAPNAFFDENLSTSRMKKAASRVDPVTRVVGRNELLVRKGDLVGEVDYMRLIAVRQAMSRSDIGLSLRGLGLLFFAAALAFSLLLKNPALRNSGSSSSMVLGIFSALAFFLIAILSGRLNDGAVSLEGSFIVPISLFTGIASALAGQGFGFAYSVILALLTASATNLNPYFFIFVLLAGIFASFTITTAKTRLDLVRAALLQAAMQFLATLVLAVQYEPVFPRLLAIGGISAANGFIAGSLLLALLPILEQSFNLPTKFRLLELSDVNAPALKELLTQAPGTYAHSMNVAHLAEAAAEDIGANALLARVGAYYHDIGKIEQPEYFVENQRGLNKHDDMNPRLSATVIRSHVKIGVERARDLKLPKEVVEIVGQHHGSSVIAWFYDKAKHTDTAARREDFSYPGSPPGNKEAGIVMLADTVEASSRTLKKPTIPRLEAHIHQIVMEKVQDGQLYNCNLTLREIDLIQRAFVRIMAGQFHSRIEYPKQKEEQR